MTQKEWEDHIDLKACDGCDTYIQGEFGPLTCMPLRGSQNRDYLCESCLSLPLFSDYKMLMN